MQQQVKRAAIYARTATSQQQELNFALATQIHECKEYATSKGYQLAEEHMYQEAGSGSSLDRVRLQELVKAAQEGQFDVLLILDFDRLSRREYLVSSFLAKLESYGVSVESVREPFAAIPLMQLIQSYQAQLEQEKLAQRLQRGKQLVKSRKEQ